MVTTKIKSAPKKTPKEIINHLVGQTTFGAGYKTFTGRKKGLQAYDSLKADIPADQIENLRLVQNKLKKIEGDPTPDQILKEMNDRGLDSIRLGDGDTRMLFRRDELEPFQGIDKTTLRNLDTYSEYIKNRNTLFQGIMLSLALKQTELDFVNDPEGSVDALAQSIMAAANLNPDEFVEALL